MELLIATFFGFMGGLLIGLLPGFGTTSFLILSFPFIADQSLLFCIVFYCVLSSVSQYFGSVTTLSFGVPGENTSLPLLDIRDKLSKTGKISEAHFLCAYGSLLASLISGLLILSLTSVFSQAIFYLKSYISLVCALIGIVLCILYSNNKIFTSIVFVIMGWAVGKIGYDEIYNQSFLTFNNVYLYAGIPVLPAIMGIYAIPNIAKIFYELKKFSNNTYRHRVSFDKIKLTMHNTKAILRSTLIGFVSGLIPYVGNGISSYLAFLTEKKLNPNNPIAQATAAESANNAANLSVLIPLVLLGVAIVPSEFVLLEIILSSSKTVSWKTLLENIYLISLCLLIANLAAFVLSWNLLKVTTNLVYRLKFWFPMLAISFIILGIYNVGFNYGQELYYVTVLLVFSIFGLLLRRYDLLPFVYAFLLQNNIEQIAYRVYKIYLS